MQTQRYVAIRAAGFFLQGSILAYSIYLELTSADSGWQRLVWFAYLTHLNLLITFYYEARAGARVFRDRLAGQDLFPILRDMAVTLSVAVTILYWALDRSSTLFNGILFHGVSTLLLLVEVVLLRQTYVPTLLSWRYFAPLLFALIYMPVEAGLTLFGMVNAQGQPIYHALPWKTDPAVAIKWSIVGLFLIALLPLILRRINKFVYHP